jgi:hypothetical protein
MPGALNMQRSRSFFGGLIGLALCVMPLRAETPSPLRLIPAEADLVVQTAGPRKLVEAVTTVELFKKIQELSNIRERLDSTTIRRFYQMVAYFERELGAAWPELLDRLGGGGAALATKLGNNQPVLFVLQGTDEKLMKKFVALGLAIFEQEATRKGSKERPVKGSHAGFETIQIGKGFHVALVGSALVLSNRQQALEKALALARGKEGAKSMAGHPGLAEAARILPKGPLAHLWLNMDRVRKTPGGAAVYKSPRDPAITVVFGGWAEIATHASFLCAGLYRQKNGLMATVRLPSGRQGMGADRVVTCPPDGKPGSRPLLEPKGVLYSTSFYWNVAGYWTEREKLFGEKNAKNFEKFDENSGRFLSSFQFSKLLAQAGAYHRIVVAHQEKGPYKKQPKTELPAFGYVLELREPEKFTRAIETVIRGAALFGGSRFGLKLAEEDYKGCHIVGYRFPEDRELKADVNDLRFNFTPCFVRVNNQFVACSTLNLCHELIDLLQVEGKTKARGSEKTSRTRLYAQGGAAVLRNFQDQLVTQTILDQALPIEEARKQVEKVIELLSQAGGLSIETTYAPQQFHFDLRLTLKK